MVADRKKPRREKPDEANGEAGQSVIEFLLMFPLLVGIAVLLVRMNMAIQVSIVNQKYTRAQTFFLAFNSPYFPSIAQREGGVNQITMGISDEVVPSDTADFQPGATRVMISRSRKLAGAEPPAQNEPAQTGFVRVRNTMTMCSQSNLIDVGGTLDKANEKTIRQGVNPKGFAYCRGPYDGENGGAP